MPFSILKVYASVNGDFVFVDNFLYLIISVPSGTSNIQLLNVIRLFTFLILPCLCF